MRVLVLGLGQYPKGSGVMAALYVAKRGDEVLVVEPHYTPAMEKNIRRLQAYPNVRVITDHITEKLLRGVDLLIRHQRIREEEPLLVAARAKGIPIETELSLFLQTCPATVMGITGTRGKSTTTFLIHRILQASKKWPKVWLAGNILASPLLDLAKMKATHLVVLEMSSFQLEGTGERGVSPSIAVWTNLLRDHLNVYPSMHEYAEAKAQIFRHQGPDGMVFLPAKKTFDEYASEAPGKVYRVGKKEALEHKILTSIPLGMQGEHNQANAEMAAAAALYLGVSPSVIKRVLKTCKGLPGRQEEIARIHGVRYINDTTATTPDATMAALKTFAAQGRIHLIFGGTDKELIFDEAVQQIKRCKAKVWLLPGTAHERIITALHTQSVPFQDVKDMAAAMKGIQAVVEPKEVVLLSPGCASFGQFSNEYHRGLTFAHLVYALQGRRKRGRT